MVHNNMGGDDHPILVLLCLYYVIPRSFVRVLFLQTKGMTYARSIADGGHVVSHVACSLGQ